MMPNIKKQRSESQLRILGLKILSQRHDQEAWPKNIAGELSAMKPGISIQVSGDMVKLWISEQPEIVKEFEYTAGKSDQ